MSVRMYEGSLPHIYWIDFKGDGVFTECAVMKRDGLGNVYYFPLNALDHIDKERLGRIVQNRNSGSFELWDLMSNMTLNNGVNALTYFHQLVMVITPAGRIMRPTQGVIGTHGQLDTRSADQRRQLEEATSMAATAAANAAAAAAAKVVRESSASEYEAAEAAEETSSATPSRRRPPARKASDSQPSE